MKNTSSQLLLGAVSLLAVNGSLLADHAVASSDSESKMTALNVASLKSIESTWLKVPAACKARGMNADATQLTDKDARDSVQAIYATYEV